jgi:hypothetical protein
MFEVFTAVTMKNVVFCNVALCDSSKNRRFRGWYRLRHQGDKNRRARNNVSCNAESTTEMFEPQRLTSIAASTACYGYSLILYIL